ncbi:MAG: hypothetical protein NVS3B21_23770 [Acidimicrobiales bacterium]
MKFTAKQRSLSLAVSEVLGTPVSIAVPLQRRDPRVVLGACAAQLATFALALMTLSEVAFLMTALAAVVLVGVRASDQRRVVAFTTSGPVIVSASLAGKPLAAVGSGPQNLTLPAPTGVGAPVRLGDRTWWVDRVDYPRLRRARELLAADRDHA